MHDLNIMTTKTTSSAIILVILTSAVLNLINFRIGHNWSGDFTWYIAQAKAIVDGSYDQLQEFSHFRQSYSTKIVGPAIYPWGYPALLAPIYYFFGSSLTAFKFYTFLFLIGSLIVSYRLFVNKISNLYLLLIIVLLAFNPNFSVYKESIYSDFPALFFALLSILIVQDVHKLSIGKYILLALTSFMAFWIRTQYIVLLPTLLLYIFYVKIKDYKVNRKAIPLDDYLKVSVILIIFGTLFLVDRMTFVAYSSYSDHLTDKNYFLVVKKNIEYYPRILAHFWGMKHLHWHRVGGGLAPPVLPHHRAYGSVPRRFM
jgi:hypothetical protein